MYSEDLTVLFEILRPQNFRNVQSNLKTTQKTTQKIIDPILENPQISRKEISVMLGDMSEDGVKYHLTKLQKEKKLKRIGAAKGGYWKILIPNQLKKTKEK